MTLITIRFTPEMEQAVFEGRKCCTTRDERKGSPGDVFRIKDRLYRILAIDERMHPHECSDFLLEGFESWGALKDELERIYPHIIKPVDSITDIGKPGSRVFVHFFAYIGHACMDFGYSGQCINKNSCHIGEYCSKKEYDYNFKEGS